MGSVGSTSVKEAAVTFPIHGVFTSKRGKTYYFRITNHGSAELWQRKSVPAPGGNRLKDFYADPTKEFWNMAETKYGVKREWQG